MIMKFLCYEQHVVKITLCFIEMIILIFEVFRFIKETKLMFIMQYCTICSTDFMLKPQNKPKCSIQRKLFHSHNFFSPEIFDKSLFAPKAPQQIYPGPFSFLNMPSHDKSLPNTLNTFKLKNARVH